MNTQRKCPRCGEFLEPEDLECPYCGCTDIPEIEINFDEQYNGDDTPDFNTVAGEVLNDDEVAPDLGWTFATEDDLADEEPFEDEDAKKAQKDNKKVAKQLAPLIAEIKNNGPNKENAILEVHNAIYKHMLAIATNRMDRDKAWAEDVYNETFNHLMQDNVIKTLKNNEKFEGWFAVALMNRCRNAWRRKGKIQKYETFESSLKTDEMNFFENIPANVLDDPAVQFEKKEVIDGLNTLLDELPYIQSACVKMTCLTGHTCKVTAAALGIPEGTVKTNVSKTKKYVFNRITELRKENKSFYAIAPIPFLMWMLKEEMEHIEGTQMIVKACELVPVIQESAEAASTISTSATSTATTETVGTSATAEASSEMAAVSPGVAKASTGLLSKITVTRGVLGLICCAVVGVGVATAINSGQKSNETTEKTAEKSETTDSNKDETKVKKKKDNRGIFDETIALYQNKINAGSGGQYDVSYDSGISPMVSLIESSGGGNGMNIGYAYYDIDGDGQSELLIGDASQEKSSTIYDIWVNTNDGPQILKDTTAIIGEGQEEETYTRLYNRATSYITKDNLILHTVNENSDSIVSLGTLKNSKYTITEKFGSLLSSNGTQTYKKLNTKTNEAEETTETKYSKFKDQYFGDSGIKNVQKFSFTLFEEEMASTAQQSTETPAPVADSTSDMQTIDLKYTGATIQIPTIFKLTSEGKGAGDWYETEYMTDGTDVSFSGTKLRLTITRYSKEEFPEYYEEQKEYDAEYGPTVEYNKMPDQTYIGNEKQFVCLYNVMSDATWQMHVVNSNGEKAYCIINITTEDMNASLTDAQTATLKNMVLAMAQSVVFQ